MNNSLNDAPADAAYLGPANSSGIYINMEVDDNDSTTAENEHLLPLPRSSYNNVLDINEAPTESSSIHLDDNMNSGATPPRAALSRSTSTRSGNLLSQFLTRQMLSLSTAPSTEALRSLITHSNFRYQPQQSVNASTAGAGVTPADSTHILLNQSATNADQSSSSSRVTPNSASLRLNIRPATSSIMGRSISLREGEMQQPHPSIGVRHNASVIGLPTASPVFDDIPSLPSIATPQVRAAGSGGDAPTGAAQQPPDPQNEHNVEEENGISEMVVHILSHLVRYMPVICILLFKFAHDHFLGILDLVVLQAVMQTINKSLRTQVTRLAQKNYAVLAADAAILVLVVTVRLFLSTAPPDPFGLLIPPPKKQYTIEIAPLPYKTNTVPTPTEAEMFKLTTSTDTFEALKGIPLGMLLYYVAVSDLIMKLLTMLIKVAITMLPMHVIRLKVRARLYVLVEYLSQFYRALPPITQWCFYLYESYSGLEVVSGGLFSLLYLGAKVFELLERGKSLKKAIIAFRRNIDSERPPTKEELDAAGAVCPICHDAYSTPVILECGHIFCDECVSTWFKREQTCPMCRAKVSDDPTWQDGATTFFLQLF